ncbi:hypothetical protein TIFTF001_009412 [Ficus carica]|uniref:rhamnogalacturonan endolyase n=1 Tax=Ficus carica TaxID=3494 RepID=A0AA87ZTR4_FICCA|nr:hypothetical protein TIFTF001_009412 [Ficus carica]
MTSFHNIIIRLPRANPNSGPTNIFHVLSLSKSPTWLLKKFSLVMVMTIMILFITTTESRHHKLDKAVPGDDNKPVSFPAVQLRIQDQYVGMDNGILEVTLSKPGGSVTGIRYNGVDNVLALNDEADRGYWDLVWIGNGSKGKKGSLDRLEGTDFKVIVENEEQIELSFTRTWNFSLEGKMVPLNVDKRFIMLRGSSGFYSYGIYEHLNGWPAFNLTNTRIAFKLREDKFHYMAISDNRQRYMPLPEDRKPERGQALAYPEAVRLVDPVEPEFKGEVDDKYEYSTENKDNRVHGWISANPPIGFWQITPSYEFRSGGPLKQCLTSHVGPTTLAIFHSTHYSGEDLILQFGPSEPWKKVYGPVFIYLNSLLEEEPDPLQLLWEDAKKQDYQFWTRADENGYFCINNIRAGDYNLYAWVPGFIGDYRYDYLVTIIPGSEVDVGDLVYEPPRNGPTLWEIGIPDRSAAEFYVPDPNPNYVNKLYVNHPQKFRQYGLWERYADLYPDGDLVYTIGVGNYSKDWFFVQVTSSIQCGAKTQYRSRPHERRGAGSLLFGKCTQYLL